MRKIFTLCILNLCILANAQFPDIRKDDLNELYKYPNLKEKNLLCAKLQVREIFINDTINSQLQWTDGKSNLLFKMNELVLDGTLTAYSSDVDYASLFSTPYSLSEIEENLNLTEEEIEFMDSETGEYLIQIVKPVLNFSDIKSVLIQELCFYNTKGELANKRIVGICPILHFQRDGNPEANAELRRRVYWVYYPEFRGHIHGQKELYANDEFITTAAYTGNIVKEWHWGPDVKSENEIETSCIYTIPLHLAVAEAAKHNENNEIKYSLTNFSNQICLDKNFDPGKVKCAKYVYKTIELKDSTNMSLYLPMEKSNLTKVQSLSQLLTYLVTQEGISIYNNDDYFLFDFDSPITENEFASKMGNENEEVMVMNENGDEVAVFIEGEFRHNEITSYLVKELNFYDQQQNLLSSRILGICPIRESTWDGIEYTRSPTAWFYYLDIKKYLARSLIQTNNITRDISFDDFFTQGLYSSSILKNSFIADINGEYNTQDEIIPVPLSKAFKAANEYAVIDAKGNALKPNYTWVKKEITELTMPETENYDSIVYYQKIDLTNTINNCLWQPINKVKGYQNLIETIIYPPENSFIFYAAQKNKTPDFTSTLSNNDVLKSMGIDSVTINYINDWGDIEEVKIMNKLNAREVLNYYIQIVKYLNDKNDIVFTKVNAICPERTYEDNDFLQFKTTPFWVKMDDLNEELKKQYIYQPKSCQYITFFEFFNQHLYVGEDVEF